MNPPGPLDAGARTRRAMSTPTNAGNAVTLADGTRLELRAISPDDRDRLAAVFARLSPQSRYRRFLSPKPELTPRELSYLTDTDHVHHVAIAAIAERDDSIAGVGRYAEYTSQPGVADIAVVVADDLHAIGIGTALATRTVQHAHTNGLTLLTATTHWENRPARALLRRLGFRPSTTPSHLVEQQLELASLNKRHLTARHQLATTTIWT
jgi:RimJ/RimL family protein N-acetyltransferase